MPVTVSLSGHGHDRREETGDDERCAPDHWADVFVVLALVFTELAVAVGVGAGGDVGVVTGPWALGAADASVCSESAIIPRASYSARCASMVGLAVSGR